MKIVVMGAGGLGCKFGAMLGEYADVWLIHHKEEHVAHIKAKGVLMAQNGSVKTVKVNAATNPAEAGEADLIIMLVKSYDTEEATKSILPIVGEKTLVVTMQNGLGNMEKIAEFIGQDRALLGVTFHGATLKEPGYTEDKGSGMTYLASTPATKEKVEKVAELFNRAGVKTEIVTDLDAVLWAKLSVTSGINPVATVLQVPNGVLGSVAEAKKLSLAAIGETMEIAAKKGITLSFDPVERFELVSKATEKMCSGTLLDALRGRRTEIDAISGQIVLEGRKVGVNTPYHQAFLDIVKAFEASHNYRVSKESLEK